MRLYFCDLCNESVPRSDLDLGRAALRKGRVVCSRCERAMSGEEPGEELAHARTPRRARSVSRQSARSEGPGASPASLASSRTSAGSSGGILAGALAIVALLFACGAAVFLLDRLERVRADVASARTTWRGELADGMERLGARVEAGVEEARAAHAAQAGEIARLAGDGTDLLDELAGAVAALEGRLAEVEGRRARAGGGADAQELDRLGRTVADLHAEVLRLTRELRDGPGAEASTTTAEDELAAGAAEPAPQTPAWQPLVADLGSRDSAARWSAVQALGETGDPAVVPHVAPMLGDPDLFVRMAAARVLGDLGDLAAVPALIDALEDPEPSVREAAAIALRAVTGRSFGFEATAGQAERAETIAKWREWWSREQKERGAAGGR